MTTGGARPHLSVVVPAFNEEDRLPATLAAIDDYLGRERIDAEVLVVDDGSSDGTSAAASAALRGRRGRVLRGSGNRGKGHAFRHGFLEATGRWVLLTDADLSTPIEEHARLAAAARDRDLDVAIASRGLPDSRLEPPQAFLRRNLGRTFNLILRATTGLPFRDTQCGFKLLDRERVLPIVGRMVVDGFAFDVELLFLCRRYGLRVEEVPVVWRNSERSAVRIVADPPRMLLDVARIRWRFRRGAYHPTGAVREGGRAADA
jgi:glycosyltransferase involved in cell wall biosynthesis